MYHIIKFSIFSQNSSQCNFGQKRTQQGLDLHQNHFYSWKNGPETTVHKAVTVLSPFTALCRLGQLSPEHLQLWFSEHQSEADTVINFCLKQPKILPTTQASRPPSSLYPRHPISPSCPRPSAHPPLREHGFPGLNHRSAALWPPCLHSAPTL